MSDPLDPFLSGSNSEDFDEAMNELLIASRWMKFLAIVGFVFLGLLAIIGLIALGTTRDGATSLAVIFIVILILFFGIRSLFLYARYIQGYWDSKRMEDLELAFTHQRALWIYNGVMLIIYLVIVGVALIFLSPNLSRLLSF
jgi:hypothetical protein